MLPVPSVLELKHPMPLLRSVAPTQSRLWLLLKKLKYETLKDAGKGQSVGGLTVVDVLVADGVVIVLVLIWLVVVLDDVELAGGGGGAADVVELAGGGDAADVLELAGGGDDAADVEEAGAIQAAS